MGWAAKLPALQWPTTRKGWAIAIGVGAMTASAAIAILATQTPGESSLLPPCMFHAATGLFCPGCGITRAMHALVRGDLIKAWQMNPLALIGLAAFALELMDRAIGQPSWWGKARAVLHDARGWAVLVIVFVIGRNLPWMPFVAWAPG
jgi:hypothetical protein